MERRSQLNCSKASRQTRCSDREMFPRQQIYKTLCRRRVKHLMNKRIAIGRGLQPKHGYSLELGQRKRRLARYVIAPSCATGEIR